MWQDFFTIAILTIAISLIIVSFCLYLEARKALQSALNPWAPNTVCHVDDATAMNNLHPLVFNGNARHGQEYTAEQVFHEIGELQFKPDTSGELWVNNTFGECETAGHAGCFKTTRQKATLYTRAGRYQLWTLPLAKRQEYMNQYGFGHTFKASTASAPS